MGIGLVVVGAICLLLSFTTLNWYAGFTKFDSVGSASFTDLHHFAGPNGADVVARAYFSWTSWVLLILMIVVGMFASAPRRGTESVRSAGLLIGLVGAALTFYAVHNLAYPGNAQIGLYLAFAGYLAGGAGAGVGSWPLGPKRATNPAPENVAVSVSDDVEPKVAAAVPMRPAVEPVRARPRPGPRPGPSPIPPDARPTDPGPPTDGSTELS